jgi:hypothetical protein
VATVTPASSNNEETHNTLKFARRAKFIPVSATRTFVEDDKALIKKYQQEIADLKAQLKQVMGSHPELLSARQQPLHSGREPASSSGLTAEALAATWQTDRAELEARIQRLKRIILHSTKTGVGGGVSPSGTPLPGWQLRSDERSASSKYDEVRVWQTWTPPLLVVRRLSDLRCSTYHPTLRRVHTAGSRTRCDGRRT